MDVVAGGEHIDILEKVVQGEISIDVIFFVAGLELRLLVIEVVLG